MLKIFFQIVEMTSIFFFSCKRLYAYFRITPSFRMSVGWLIFSFIMGGKLHFHAPIGAFVCKLKEASSYEMMDVIGDCIILLIFF